MEVTVTNITTEVEIEAGYDLFEVVVTASDSIIIEGGAGVQSVTGDGVGGTSANPVLTFPTSSQITENTNKRFVTDSDLVTLSNTSGINTGDQVIPENTSDLNNDGEDGVNAFVTQLDINSAKLIEVTGVEVLAASFALVGDLYEASISNENILASSSVDVVPASSTIAIVKAADFMPETVASSGSVKVFATNLPTDNFFVTLLIQPTNG
jgi:hypothetical protein